MSRLSAGFASALLALSCVSPASAFWRLQCFGVAGVARIDPIVDPGAPSNHVHAIKGASGLNFNSTAADLLQSKCTSCQVQQDHSAYWEPQLYFFASNGTISIVPEVAGHLTYYKYTPCYISNGTLMNPVAMPNDLRILSGNPYRRNFTLPVPDPPLPWSGADATQDALAQKAIGFNCLNYQKAPEPSLYRHFLPDKSYLDANCVDGIRVEVLFPYCWNGELDSPDHKSHMAFPDANLNGGKCPEGYDQVTNQLFFETIYPVQNYVNDDGYFAFSNGDPTGYGVHGDVLIAWEDGVLAQATEECGPVTGVGASGITSDCPIFDMVPQDAQASCQLESIPAPCDKDDVTYNMSALPGYNPIQTGPEQATPPPHGSGAPSSAPTNPASLSSAVPSLSYTSATTSDYGISAAAGQSSSSSPAGAGTTPPPSVQGAQEQELNAEGSGPESSTSVTVTTIYSTSGAAVYELVVVQEDIYVTVEPTPAPAVKRSAAELLERRDMHAHAHVHNHAKRRHEHHPRR